MTQKFRSPALELMRQWIEAHCDDDPTESIRALVDAIQVGIGTDILRQLPRTRAYHARAGELGAGELLIAGRVEDLIREKTGLHAEPGQPVERKARRGQALVEFALVLPILMFLILGGLGLGLGLIHRSQLQHVAQEVAVSAATDGCAIGLARVNQLLDYNVDDKTCDASGQVVSVQLTHAYPVIAPFLPSSISVEARAVIR